MGTELCPWAVMTLPGPRGNSPKIPMNQTKTWPGSPTLPALQTSAMAALAPCLSSPLLENPQICQALEGRPRTSLSVLPGVAMLTGAPLLPFTVGRLLGGCHGGWLELAQGSSRVRACAPNPWQENLICVCMERVRAHGCECLKTGKRIFRRARIMAQGWYNFLHHFSAIFIVAVWR